MPGMARQLRSVPEEGELLPVVEVGAMARLRSQRRAGFELSGRGRAAFARGYRRRKPLVAFGLVAILCAAIGATLMGRFAPGSQAVFEAKAASARRALSEWLHGQAAAESLQEALGADSGVPWARALLNEAPEVEEGEQGHEAACNAVPRWLREWGWFFVIFGVLYLFLGLAIICDDFFVASLEAISEKLELSEDVAGATFMAAGSSAPELFSSSMSLVSSAGNEIGVGTIVGSAVFNVLMIIGATAYMSGRTMALDWKPLVRDCFFYTLAIIGTILVFMDGVVHWYEGLGFVTCYAFYIAFMWKNEKIMRWVDDRVQKSDGKVAPKERKQGRRQSVFIRERERMDTVVDGQAVIDGQAETERIEDGGADAPTAKVETIDGNSGALSACPPEEASRTALSEQTDADGAANVCVAKNPEHRVVRNTFGNLVPIVSVSNDAVHLDGSNAESFATAIMATIMIKRFQRKCVRSMRSRLLAAARRCENGSARNSLACANESQGEGPDKAGRTERKGSLSALRKRNQSVIVFQEADGSQTVHMGSLKLAEEHAARQAAEKAEASAKGDGGVRSTRLAAGVPVDKDAAVNGGHDGDDVEAGKMPSSALAGAKPIENVGAADDDDDELNPFEWPADGGFLDKALWAPSLPWYVLFTYTVPNCATEKWEKFYLVSFVGSIVWIGAISYFMVEWAHTFGCIVGAPTVVMGTTVLAAGTSVPDALSSIVVARQGLGDMAVANAIGSNVFDIWLGLGVPWAILLPIKYGGRICVRTEDLTVNILILFGVLFSYITCIVSSGFKLTRTVGLVLMISYVIYALHNIVLVWVLDVYGWADAPACTLA